jgi:hypothetical protein
VGGETFINFDDPPMDAGPSGKTGQHNSIGYCRLQEYVRLMLLRVNRLRHLKSSTIFEPAFFREIVNLA